MRCMDYSRPHHSGDGASQNVLLGRGVHLLTVSQCCYCAIDERAALLKSAFMTEALHQWNQSHDDSLLTAAAGLLISMACVTNGDDRLHTSILRDTQHMAIRLGLYGTSSDVSRAHEASHRSLADNAA